MFLIIYDVVFEEEVMEVMAKCCVPGYTKWERVLGKGKRSDPKLDNAVWPGYNSAMLVAVETESEELFYSSLCNLCERLGHKSLKVFSWTSERVI
ncbi:MAG: PG0541 family transporter-associated protein [Desulfatiglandales bacterium]